MVIAVMPKNVTQIPTSWPWREMVSEAISDAQGRLGITQAVLSRELGVSRSVMLWARSTDIWERDAPRPAFGLAKTTKLAELAGWKAKKRREFEMAWTQEMVFRVQREHFETIALLEEEEQAKRWKKLTDIALASERNTIP